MKSNIDKEACKKISELYNLPQYVIEKVIDAVYIDLRNTIEDNTLDGYRLPYFGKFYQSEGMVKKLERFKKYVDSKRKLQDNNTEHESSEQGI